MKNDYMDYLLARIFLIIAFVLIVSLIIFVSLSKKTFEGYYLSERNSYPTIMMSFDNREDIVFYSSKNTKEVMDEWQKIVDKHLTISDYENKEKIVAEDKKAN